MQNTNHANTKTPTLDARLPKFQHLISAIFNNLKYGKLNIVWADGSRDVFTEQRLHRIRQRRLYLFMITDFSAA